MPSQSKWDSQKDVIRELYLNQKYTLKELQERMNDAGFVATKSQYETKFKAWGFSKNASNISAATWKHVGYKMAKRKRENEDSAVIIDGTEIDSKRVKKEISRYTYSTMERIKLESIGAPSPPGPLAVVATPRSSQSAFSINHWPDDLPWLVFVRSMNTGLVSLHQENEIIRAPRHDQYALQSRAQHGVISPNQNVSTLGVWQKSRHITTGRERRSIIHTILPPSFFSHDTAVIDHSMSLLSTTSSHWAIKVLIYLASNNFLKADQLDRIWRLLEQSGVKELATISQSLHLGEVSLKAAMECLFEASIDAGRRGIVSWLLDNGVDPNSRIKSRFDGMSHLPLCKVMVYQLSLDRKSMANLLLSQGASPLIRCCEKHKTGVHLALMDPGIDAKTLDMFLQAVISAQSQERSTQHPKDLCREHRTNFQISEAQQHGDEISLKMKLLVEKSSTSRESPLSPETLVKAIESNNHRLIRVLHGCGLSMDCHNFISRPSQVESFCKGSPLAAAITGQALGFYPREYTTVDLLLELGASPNYNPYPDRNDLCSHALQAAVHSSNSLYRTRFVQILIKKGAKPQGSVSCGYETHRSLMDCALEGNIQDQRGSYEEVIKALHSAGLAFPKESLTWYLDNITRHCFVHGSSESVELLQLLISKTTDWTLESKKGWTALDYVTQAGMNELKELMIKKNAVHSRRFTHKPRTSRSFRLGRIKTPSGRIPAPQTDKQERNRLFYRIMMTLIYWTLYRTRTTAPRIEDQLTEFSRLARSPKHEAYIILHACSTGNQLLIDHTLKLFPDPCSPVALEILLWYQKDRAVDYWQLIEKLLGRHFDNSSSLQSSQKMRILSRAIYSEVSGSRDSRVLDWFHEHGGAAFELANSHPSSFLIKCLWPPSPVKMFQFPDNVFSFLNHDTWKFWKDLHTGRNIKYRLKPSTYLGLWVAHEREVGWMKDLLQHGLRPIRRFPWAFTALQSAVAHGDLEMSHLLLEARAAVNARAPWRNVPQSLEYEFGDDLCFDCPVENGRIRGRNALQLAVEEGDLKMIELLLRYNANINAPPAPLGGATALQIACMKGYIDIARLLLEKGAEVDAAGAKHSGRTALEGAAEHGRLDMVFLLLERGCLVQGSSRIQYIRAVGFARAEAHHTVAMELQKHGGWTTDDEDRLKRIDLRDSDLDACPSEDLSLDGEEISEIDLSESDESCRFSAPLESDSDGETGHGDATWDDDLTRDDGDAEISDEHHPKGIADECMSSESGHESATPQHDSWDELIEYFGDDEGVDCDWESF